MKILLVLIVLLTSCISANKGGPDSGGTKLVIPKVCQKRCSGGAKLENIDVTAHCATETLYADDGSIILEPVIQGVMSNQADRLQRIINYFSSVVESDPDAEQKTIVIPSGYYTLDSPIEMKSGVIIAGSEKHNTFLKKSNNATPANKITIGNGYLNNITQNTSIGKIILSNHYIDIEPNTENITLSSIMFTGTKHPYQISVFGKNILIEDNLFFRDSSNKGAAILQGTKVLLNSSDQAVDRALNCPESELYGNAASTGSCRYKYLRTEPELMNLVLFPDGGGTNKQNIELREFPNADKEGEGSPVVCDVNWFSSDKSVFTTELNAETAVTKRTLEPLKVGSATLDVELSDSESYMDEAQDVAAGTGASSQKVSIVNNYFASPKSAESHKKWKERMKKRFENLGIDKNETTSSHFTAIWHAKDHYKTSFSNNFIDGIADDSNSMIHTTNYCDTDIFSNYFGRWTHKGDQPLKNLNAESQWDIDEKLNIAFGAGRNINFSQNHLVNGRVGALYSSQAKINGEPLSPKINHFYAYYNYFSGKAKIALDTVQNLHINNNWFKPQPIDQTVYLRAGSAISHSNVQGGLKSNVSYYGNPITIHGHTYSRGLTMHPPHTTVAQATFQVPASVKTFFAVIAVMKSGHVRMKVLVDGVEKASYEVWDNKNGQQIEVDVAGANTMTLVVDPLGSNDSDHAVWADAKFHAKRTVGEHLRSADAIEASEILEGLKDDRNFDDWYLGYLNKKIYNKGISMHTSSHTNEARAVFSIPSGVKTFSTVPGMTNTSGDVGMAIEVDGVNQFYQARVLHNSNLSTVEIDVENASQLTLIVDPRGSRHYDHAVWGDAKFQRHTDDIHPERIHPLCQTNTCRDTQSTPSDTHFGMDRLSETQKTLLKNFSHKEYPKQGGAVNGPIIEPTVPHAVCLEDFAEGTITPYDITYKYTPNINKASEVPCPTYQKAVDDNEEDDCALAKYRYCRKHFSDLTDSDRFELGNIPSISVSVFNDSRLEGKSTRFKAATYGCENPIGSNKDEKYVFLGANIKYNSSNMSASLEQFFAINAFRDANKTFYGTIYSGDNATGWDNDDPPPFSYIYEDIDGWKCFGLCRHDIKADIFTYELLHFFKRDCVSRPGITFTGSIGGDMYGSMAYRAKIPDFNDVVIIQTHDKHNFWFDDWANDWRGWVTARDYEFYPNDATLKGWINDAVASKKEIVILSYAHPDHYDSNMRQFFKDSNVMAIFYADEAENSIQKSAGCDETECIIKIGAAYLGTGIVISTNKEEKKFRIYSVIDNEFSHLAPWYEFDFKNSN